MTDLLNIYAFLYEDNKEEALLERAQSNKLPELFQEVLKTTLRQAKDDVKVTTSLILRKVKFKLVIEGSAKISYTAMEARTHQAIYAMEIESFSGMIRQIQLQIRGYERVIDKVAGEDFSVGYIDEYFRRIKDYMGVIQRTLTKAKSPPTQRLVTLMNGADFLSKIELVRLSKRCTEELDKFRRSDYRDTINSILDFKADFQHFWDSLLERVQQEKKASEKNIALEKKSRVKPKGIDSGKSDAEVAQLAKTLKQKSKEDERKELNKEEKKQAEALGIAIGEQDFKKLITDNNHFIDKSLLIQHAMTADIKEGSKDKSKVSVITRPRRFGKTLNMSMLYYFLSDDVSREWPDNDKRPNKNRETIFRGLKIGQTKDFAFDDHFARYKVISFTMKDIDTATEKAVFHGLANIMSKQYAKFSYIIEYLQKEKKISRKQFNQFDRLTNGNLDSGELEYSEYNIDLLKKSLDLLCEYIENYINCTCPSKANLSHSKGVIILIDEYDTPMIHSLENPEARKLLSGFLLSGLKGERYHKAIVTGIARVAQESLFSKLNHPTFYTLLQDNIFSGDFGFTQEEVEQELILPTLVQLRLLTDTGKNISNTWPILWKSLIVREPSLLKTMACKETEVRPLNVFLHRWQLIKSNHPAFVTWLQTQASMKALQDFMVSFDKHFNEKCQAFEDWYGGYGISTSKVSSEEAKLSEVYTQIVYSPWSVLKACANKLDIQEYWNQTAITSLLDDVFDSYRNFYQSSPKASSTKDKRQEAAILRFQSLYPDLQTKLLQLSRGRTVDLELTEHLLFSTLMTRASTLWCLLLSTGYLTITYRDTVEKKLFFDVDKTADKSADGKVKSSEKSFKAYSVKVRLVNQEIIEVIKKGYQQWFKDIKVEKALFDRLSNDINSPDENTVLRGLEDLRHVTVLDDALLPRLLALLGHTLSDSELSTMPKHERYEKLELIKSVRSEAKAVLDYHNKLTTTAVIQRYQELLLSSNAELMSLAWTQLALFAKNHNLTETQLDEVQEGLYHQLYSQVPDLIRLSLSGLLTFEEQTQRVFAECMKRVIELAKSIELDKNLASSGTDMLLTYLIQNFKENAFNDFLKQLRPLINDHGSLGYDNLKSIVLYLLDNLTTNSIDLSQRFKGIVRKSLQAWYHDSKSKKNFESCLSIVRLTLLWFSNESFTSELTTWLKDIDDKMPGFKKIASSLQASIRKKKNVEGVAKWNPDYCQIGLHFLKSLFNIDRMMQNPDLLSLALQQLTSCSKESSTAFKTLGIWEELFDTYCAAFKHLDAFEAKFQFVLTHLAKFKVLFVHHYLNDEPRKADFIGVFLKQLHPSLASPLDDTALRSDFHGSVLTLIFELKLYKTPTLQAYIRKHYPYMTETMQKQWVKHVKISKKDLTAFFEALKVLRTKAIGTGDVDAYHEVLQGLEYLQPDDAEFWHQCLLDDLSLKYPALRNAARKRLLKWSMRDTEEALSIKAKLMKHYKALLSSDGTANDLLLYRETIESLVRLGESKNTLVTRLEKHLSNADLISSHRWQNTVRLLQEQKWLFEIAIEAFLTTKSGDTRETVQMQCLHLHDCRLKDRGEGYYVQCYNQLTLYLSSNHSRVRNQALELMREYDTEKLQLIRQLHHLATNIHSNELRVFAIGALADECKPKSSKVAKLKEDTIELLKSFLDDSGVEKAAKSALKALEVEYESKLEAQLSSYISTGDVEAAQTLLTKEGASFTLKELARLIDKVRVFFPDARHPGASGTVLLERLYELWENYLTEHSETPRTTWQNALLDDAYKGTLNLNEIRLSVLKRLRTITGLTVLHLAALGQQTELVKALLAQKFPTNVRDMHGHDAATLASNRGYQAIAQLIRRSSSVQPKPIVFTEAMLPRKLTTFTDKVNSYKAAHEPDVLVLTGKPGTGKLTMAQHVIKVTKPTNIAPSENIEKFVHRCNASTLITLRQSYLDMAAQLSIKLDKAYEHGINLKSLSSMESLDALLLKQQLETLRQAIQPALSKQPYWVMLYENVSESEVMTHVSALPGEARGIGIIIIITQNADLDSFVTAKHTHIDLDRGVKASKIPAWLTLHGFTPSITKEDAKNLERELKGQPMALALMVKVLQANDWSIDIYLKHYNTKKKSKKPSLEKSLLEAEIPIPIYLALRITYNILKGLPQASLIICILKVASFLSRDPIELNFLRHYLKKMELFSTEDALIQGLLILQRYHLVTLDTKKTHFKIHRVVQQIICKWQKYALPNFNEMYKTLLGYVHEYYKDIAKTPIESYRTVREGLSHLLALESHCPLELKNSGTQAVLYSDIGYVHQYLGDYQSAYQYHTFAMTIHSEHPEPKPLSTQAKLLINQCQRARALYRLGKYNEAFKEQTIVLNRRKQLKQNYSHVSADIKLKMNLDLAVSYLTLGLIHMRCERWSEAIKAVEKSLTLRTRHLINKSSDVGTYCSVLGEIYTHQGEYNKAKEELQKAVRIFKAGKLSRKTSVCYNQFGGLCREQGEFERARLRHEQARDIILTTLGANHQEMAYTYFQLALLYEAQEDYKTANHYHWRAFAINSSHLDLKHTHNLTFYHHAGVNYRHLDECAKSLDFLTRAVKWRNALFGDTAPHVVGQSLVALARTHLQFDMFADAEKRLEEAKKLYALPTSRALPRDNFEFTSTQYELCLARLASLRTAPNFLESKDWKTLCYQAKKYLAELNQLVEASPALKSVYHTHATFLQAKYCYLTEDYSEAKRLLEAVLNTIELTKLSTPLMWDIPSLLGATAMKLGDFEGAEHQYKHAKDLLEKKGAARVKVKLHLLHQLGEVIMQRYRPLDARRYFDEGLELLDIATSLKVNDSKSFQILYLKGLAESYELQGDEIQAIELTKKELQLRQACRDKLSRVSLSNIVACQCRLAALCRIYQRFEEAKDYLTVANTAIKTNALEDKKVQVQRDLEWFALHLDKRELTEVTQDGLVKLAAMIKHFPESRARVLFKAQQQLLQARLNAVLKIKKNPTLKLFANAIHTLEKKGTRDWHCRLLALQAQEHKIKAYQENEDFEILSREYESLLSEYLVIIQPRHYALRQIYFQLARSYEFKEHLLKALYYYGELMYFVADNPKIIIFINFSEIVGGRALPPYVPLQETVLHCIQKCFIENNAQLSRCLDAHFSDESIRIGGSSKTKKDFLINCTYLFADFLQLFCDRQQTAVACQVALALCRVQGRLYGADHAETLKSRQLFSEILRHNKLEGQFSRLLKSQKLGDTPPTILWLTVKDWQQWATETALTVKHEQTRYCKVHEIFKHLEVSSSALCVIETEAKPQAIFAIQRTGKDTWQSVYVSPAHSKAAQQLRSDCEAVMMAMKNIHMTTLPCLMGKYPEGTFSDHTILLVMHAISSYCAEGLEGEAVEAMRVLDPERLKQRILKMAKYPVEGEVSLSKRIEQLELLKVYAPTFDESLRLTGPRLALSNFFLNPLMLNLPIDNRKFDEITKAFLSLSKSTVLVLYGQQEMDRLELARRVHELWLYQFSESALTQGTHIQWILDAENEMALKLSLDMLYKSYSKDILPDSFMNCPIQEIIHYVFTTLGTYFFDSVASQNQTNACSVTFILNSVGNLQLLTTLVDELERFGNVYKWVQLHTMALLDRSIYEDCVRQPDFKALSDLLTVDAIDMDSLYHPEERGILIQTDLATLDAHFSTEELEIISVFSLFLSKSVKAQVYLELMTLMVKIIPSISSATVNDIWKSLSQKLVKHNYMYIDAAIGTQECHYYLAESMRQHMLTQYFKRPPAHEYPIPTKAPAATQIVSSYECFMDRVFSLLRLGFKWLKSDASLEAFSQAQQFVMAYTCIAHLCTESYGIHLFGVKLKSIELDKLDMHYKELEKLWFRERIGYAKQLNNHSSIVSLIDNFYSEALTIELRLQRASSQIQMGLLTTKEEKAITEELTKLGDLRVRHSPFIQVQFLCIQALRYWYQVNREAFERSLSEAEDQSMTVIDKGEDKNLLKEWQRCKVNVLILKLKRSMWQLVMDGKESSQQPTIYKEADDVYNQLKRLLLSDIEKVRIHLEMAFIARVMNEPEFFSTYAKLAKNAAEALLKKSSLQKTHPFIGLAYKNYSLALSLQGPNHVHEAYLYYLKAFPIMEATYQRYQWARIEPRLRQCKDSSVVQDILKSRVPSNRLASQLSLGEKIERIFDTLNLIRWVYGPTLYVEGSVDMHRLQRDVDEFTKLYDRTYLHLPHSIATMEDYVKYLKLRKQHFPSPKLSVFSTIKKIKRHSLELETFEVEKVLGDGNCGFSATGWSRATVVEALLKLADDEVARACLAVEIRQTLQSGNYSSGALAKESAMIKACGVDDEGRAALVRKANDALETLMPGYERKGKDLNAIGKLLVKFPELRIHSCALDECYRAYEENQSQIKEVAVACATKECYQRYVNEFIGRNEWVGYASLFLTAQQKHVNLYLYALKPETHTLELVASFHSDKATQTLHLLRNSAFTHYDKLLPISGEKALERSKHVVALAQITTVPEGLNLPKPWPHTTFDSEILSTSTATSEFPPTPTETPTLPQKDFLERLQTSILSASTSGEEIHWDVPFSKSVCDFLWGYIKNTKPVTLEEQSWHKIAEEYLIICPNASFALHELLYIYYYSKDKTSPFNKVLKSLTKELLAKLLAAERKKMSYKDWIFKSDDDILSTCTAKIVMSRCLLFENNSAKVLLEQLQRAFYKLYHQEAEKVTAENRESKLVMKLRAYIFLFLDPYIIQKKEKGREEYDGCQNAIEFKATLMRCHTLASVVKAFVDSKAIKNQDNYRLYNLTISLWQILNSSINIGKSFTEEKLMTNWQNVLNKVTVRKSLTPRRLSSEFHEIPEEKARYVDDSAFIVCDTKGSGDCAFHACLGSLNKETKIYADEDIHKHRSILSDCVLNVKSTVDKHLPKNPLWPLIQTCLQAALMETEGAIDLGKVGQALREAYEQHKVCYEAKRNDLKVRLNTWLNTQEDITSFIDTTFATLNTKAAYSNWVSKLDVCRQEQPGFLEELKARCKKHTVFLQTLTAWCKPNSASGTFSWKTRLEYNDIKETLLPKYAEHLKTSGNWLLPMEIGLLAYVFKKNIRLYTVDGHSLSNSTATVRSKPEVYSYDKATPFINVQFNGVNHFERMVIKAPKTTLTQSSSFFTPKESKQRIQPKTVYFKLIAKALTGHEAQKKPILDFIQQNPNNKAFDYDIWSAMSYIASSLKRSNIIRKWEGETLADKIYYFLESEESLEKLDSKALHNFCADFLQKCTIAGKPVMELHVKLKAQLGVDRRNQVKATRALVTP